MLIKLLTNHDAIGDNGLTQDYLWFCDWAETAILAFGKTLMQLLNIVYIFIAQLFFNQRIGEASETVSSDIHTIESALSGAVLSRLGQCSDVIGSSYRKIRMVYICLCKDLSLRMTEDELH